MKIVIVYDSYFGNTEAIAKAMADSLRIDHEVTLSKVAQFDVGQVQGCELAIVGTPTRAFRATKEIKETVELIVANYPGLNIAIFDTRMDVVKVDNKFLKFMARHFGYGSDDLKKAVQKSRDHLIGESLGVYVAASEGPLEENEDKRAVAWAKNMVRLARDAQTIQ